LFDASLIAPLMMLPPVGTRHADTLRRLRSYEDAAAIFAAAMPMPRRSAALLLNDADAAAMPCQPMMPRHAHYDAAMLICWRHVTTPAGCFDTAIEMPCQPALMRVAAERRR
jgi:hypothetical protein